MKRLLFIFLLFTPTLLFAQQTWEPGAFSCVAGENGENTWQAIAGQPLDVVTVANGSILLYGNTEVASSIAEAEEIRSIRLDKNTLSLEIGQSARLSVAFDAEADANRALVWHSSDESIASIDETGEVKALRAGEAVLTAITASGNYADACTLTVTRSAPAPEPDPIPVTDVTLNLTSATMECGESLRLTATVSPAYADNTSVRWSTSDPAIANVDPTGLVQALSPGSVVITVTTDDGDLSATCEITINELPTSIGSVDERRMVYPRIVKERLRLNLPSAQPVYLIDASGRIIQIHQAPAGESTISMSGYPAGIYWVRLSGQAVSIIKE